jgi:hypothetical protein
LTGSSNSRGHVTPLSPPSMVSCVQQWNPHVDITSGSPAIGRPVLQKRRFGSDVQKFAKNPFLVRSPQNLSRM